MFETLISNFEVQISNFCRVPRVAGIDLQKDKRIDMALTRLYGVGRSNVYGILTKANVDPAKRVSEISEDEANRLTQAIDFKVEGDLRAEVSENIKGLREIQSYRGIRHAKNLPVRGQRTKSNARTKRGKRVTIGAIKKELAEKMGLTPKEGEKTEEKK